MNASPKTSFAGIVALCLLLLANACIDRVPFSNATALLVDFQAFYCAGSVYAAGGNPYRVEPLQSCERREVVLPAPFPSYDLAFFSLFAKFPFKTAVVLWEILLTISFGVTVFALTRLTRLDPLVIFATLLFSNIVSALFFGQLIPIATAALSVGMLYISRKQYVAAALCTACSLIEPHVGLGACLGLFLFAPPSRAALLGVGACLLCISAASHTFLNDLEYVQTVLPAHVLSEINNEDQYSLTHLLHFWGAAESAATALGSASYLVLLTTGLLCAEAISRKTGDRAFLIALPPAFSLIGGPFLHIHQMAAALPAALLLFARFSSYRFPMGIAIFLLAVPWIDNYQLIHLGAALAVTTVVLSARLLQAPLPAQALVSIVTTTAMFLANYAYVPTPSRHIVILPSSPKAPAEETWRMFIDAYHTNNQLLFLLLKIPTWTALLIVAGIAFQIGYKERFPRAREEASFGRP